MSYRIDYGESISSVVPRLRQEHKEIHRSLTDLEEYQIEKTDLKVAVSSLKISKAKKYFDTRWRKKRDWRVSS